jgi:hypothetical protein
MPLPSLPHPLPHGPSCDRTLPRTGRYITLSPPAQGLGDFNVRCEGNPGKPLAWEHSTLPPV